ncbi:MAG: MarR family transcriptional regulator [bacterium]
MEALNEYILKTLGHTVRQKDLQKQELDRLPFYIKSAFLLRKLTLMDHEVVIAKAASDIPMTIQQIEKQFQVIYKALIKPVVLVVDDLSALARKRLIEKGINFIVPDKQLFLPALLMDLKEMFKKPKRRKESLLPSAQVILLYRILKRDDRIEEYTFKELAVRLKYTPMAITKAAENLRFHNLCEVNGTKKKYLQFPKSIPDLWNAALPLLVTPVLKRTFVDALPKKTALFVSNTSALPAFSDVNESKQKYYALEKTAYYVLHKEGELLNVNDHEGAYCLEIWKYDPGLLIERTTKEQSVDPLSLYLSMRDSNDERIEMALDKLLRDAIW